MVGWFTIESHEKESVIMRYKEEGTKKIKRIGAVYIRPLKEVKEVEKRMEEMTKCDLIIGDLNARNPIWGGEAEDKVTNSYGRKLTKWLEKENRSVARIRERTFRQVSVLDIAIYKTEDEPPKISMTDKGNLEHLGQLTRIRVEKPSNLKKENVAWKKVNWEENEKLLKEVDIDEDGGWKGLKDIIDKLPKSKGGIRKNGWWTEELERMAKDAKKMRRCGNEGWKITRKV